MCMSNCPDYEENLKRGGSRGWQIHVEYLEWALGKIPGFGFKSEDKSERIPTDPQICNLLDPVDPKYRFPVFNERISEVQYSPNSGQRLSGLLKSRMTPPAVISICGLKSSNKANAFRTSIFLYTQRAKCPANGIQRTFWWFQRSVWWEIFKSIRQMSYS